jgi:hypothetical protein
MLAAAIFWWYEGYKQVTFVDLAPPTVLVDDIQSYWSVDQFTQYLQQRSLEFEVGKEIGGKFKSRPPHLFVEVQVNNYRHHGVEGILTGRFFNNRLATVLFYPADVDTYFKRLASETALDLVTSAETIQPELYRRIWVYPDHTGKKYVGWEDTRLRDEMSLWIKRYA